MSHIVEAKTSIKNPDRNLLRQAVALVAEQHQGGQVTDFYKDFGMNDQPTELAILTTDLNRGMAVLVDPQTGELKFKGDFWMRDSAAEAIQSQITQTYVALATQQVLQQMGYVVEAAQDEQQLVLTGVQYA